MGQPCYLVKNLAGNPLGKSVRLLIKKKNMTKADNIKRSTKMSNKYRIEGNTLIFNDGITEISFDDLHENVEVEYEDIDIPDDAYGPYSDGAPSGYYVSCSAETKYYTENTDKVKNEVSSKITNIIIPDGVTEIKHGAFWNCDFLESVSIPDSVKKIDENAFGYCSSLKHIDIPQSVKEIGKNAFAYCSSLKHIDVPQSVKEIGLGAFEFCKSLANIVLSDNITEIKENTFRECLSLKSVTIPESVIKIGASAFDGCRSLASVLISDNVTEIEKRSFAGCVSLEDINIPKNITEINYGVFALCKSLKYVDIPENVTRIDDEAFSGCTSLFSVEVPENVTEIGEGVFRNCDSLETATILGNIPEIPDRVFKNCNALKTVSLPSNVAKINSNAFNRDKNTCDVKCKEGSLTELVLKSHGDYWGPKTVCEGSVAEDFLKSDEVKTTIYFPHIYTSDKDYDLKLEVTKKGIEINIDVYSCHWFEDEDWDLLGGKDIFAEDFLEVVSEFKDGTASIFNNKGETLVADIIDDYYKSSYSNNKSSANNSQSRTSNEDVPF